VSKFSQLDALTQVAALRKTEAERQLGESVAAVEAKRAEVEQLRRFMDEYAERGAETVRTGLWTNRQLFVGRLRDAVAQREQELAAALERYAAAAERWRDTHGEAEALENLAERQARAARRLLEHRAQAELDEFAGRAKK
jgi:flagellar export protein FliJ